MSSSDVTAGQTATAAQYNALREEVVANTDAINNAFLADLTAGESILGATSPAPVYKDASTGKIYKADANDTTKMQFLGFAVTSAGADEEIKVQGHGVVSGFTGLTVGAEYFVQDAAGTIGTTPSTTQVIPVGVAISATQLLIRKSRLVRLGSLSDWQASGASAYNDDLTVAVGFKPRIIVIHYQLMTINATTTPSYPATYGSARYEGTTLRHNLQLGVGQASTANYTITGAGNGFGGNPTCGDDASSRVSKVVLSILSVSDTGFVLRRAFSLGGPDAASSAWARIRYEAYE